MIDREIHLLHGLSLAPRQNKGNRVHLHLGFLEARFTHASVGDAGGIPLVSSQP